MIKKIKKELLYYTIIFVVLALAQHQDLLSTPLLRLEDMQTQGNYLHPFIWAFVVYILIGSFRWLLGIIMRLKK